MNPDIFRSHDEPQSALTAPDVLRGPLNINGTDTEARENICLLIGA